ncbi:MAG: RNA polymerase sigma-70 factor [Bacteroidota bacterium]|nr:RNA polymerase sigma-70 factor [Bacteroidota bacterium]
MNIQEKIILLQLKAGNDQAFRYIFTHYYVSLCKVADFYVNDSSVAENIVEDLMLYLWENHESVEIRTSLKGCLFSAVRNRSINYIQKAYVMRETSFPDDIEAFGPADNELNPFDKMIEEELESKIRLCIEQLPDECRTVFTLSRYENLTYEEIAKQLGISVNTVYYHIRNALVALRKNLSEYICVLIVVIKLLHLF